MLHKWKPYLIIGICILLLGCQKNNKLIMNPKQKEQPGVTQISIWYTKDVKIPEDKQDKIRGRLEKAFERITNLEEWEKEEKNTEYLAKEIMEMKEKEIFEGLDLTKDEVETVKETLKLRYLKGWISYDIDGIEAITIPAEEYEKNPDLWNIPGIENHIE
ncbi:MAG: hypothetical protein Q4Q07_06140 [Tissierellia bacterium]|nr:hypothetical protein [Tissierellia bacterium]